MPIATKLKEARQKKGMESMKRKFVVDYRENGVYKHQILNVDHTGNMTDKEIGLL